MVIATDGTTINTFSNEDNDSKIFSPFINASVIVADGAVDIANHKSIYQRAILLLLILQLVYLQVV